MALLQGCRLLKIDGRPVSVVTRGPNLPAPGHDTLTSAGNPDAVAFLEWSNTIAMIFDKQGKTVSCEFTDATRRQGSPARKSRRQDEDGRAWKCVTSSSRSQIDGASANLPVLAEPLAQPGELSQGLCSPWQNDYRECACYYWAASRPDYVNVTAADDGTSRGDNWIERERTGTYVPDNRDPMLTLSLRRPLSPSGRSVLKFVIRGVEEKPKDGP